MKTLRAKLIAGLLAVIALCLAGFGYWHVYNIATIQVVGLADNEDPRKVLEVMRVYPGQLLLVSSGELERRLTESWSGKKISVTFSDNAMKVVFE